MHRQKETVKDPIDTFLYTSACLGILPSYDLVFKQLRLLVLPNYIVYLWNTWMDETEGTISLVDHLVLVSLYVFVIAGERITQH